MNPKCNYKPIQQQQQQQHQQQLCFWKNKSFDERKRIVCLLWKKYIEKVKLIESETEDGKIEWWYVNTAVLCWWDIIVVVEENAQIRFLSLTLREMLSEICES